MVEDYNYDEKTFIATLLSESMSEVNMAKCFKYLPDYMIIGHASKIIYGIAKDLYNSEDRVLIGTTHFQHKVEQIAFLECETADEYFADLDIYWSPSVTIFNWLKKIQDRYFTEKFKEATSQEEFEKIIEEKQKYSIEQEMSDLSEDGAEALDEYEKRKDTAIKIHLPSVNKIVGSLAGGDMVVLAGSTGGGKTAFMLNLAVGMAKSGKKVDIFSLEMPKYQLQQRIVCAETNIDTSKFRSYQLSDKDKEKYKEYTQNGLKKLPIRIYKQQTVTVEDIKHIEMKSNADVVFIDYLGLINSYNNKSSYEKFSEISRNIKLIAMASNKPIVCLHQLNRAFQQREDKTPKTSDLRDSGQIEQDADMIWFVYRPGLFDESIGKEQMKFLVAKNRHGESNKTVDLVFNGMYQQVLEPIL